MWWVLLLLYSASVLGQTPPEPQCICLQELVQARGLRSPLIMRFPDDGTNRTFVGEQVGVLWIFQPDGTRLPQPYLNLTEVVITSEFWGDERGFLQIAFHPDFRNNRRIYMYYTVEDEDEELFARLSEIQQSVSNPNVVDYNTERVLMTIYQPYPNHNGGDILFGLDGYLYLSTGDGGLFGDPHDYSLDLTSNLGKMLRIDVNRRDPGLEYGIPPDNPYLNEPSALRELYAIGLRNPWRNDLDEGDRQSGSGRGRIFVSDVGQSWMEEINILQSRGNYGWSSREGTDCYKPNCGDIGPEVLPIFAYNHTVGQSITGGHIYRGCESPAFNGMYFYADYMDPKLFRLKEEGSNWVNRELFTCGTDFCRARGLEGIDHDPDNDYGQILSFGEDQKGEVYYLTTDFAAPTNPEGQIFKIVDPYNRVPNC